MTSGKPLTWLREDLAWLDDYRRLGLSFAEQAFVDQVGRLVARHGRRLGDDELRRLLTPATSRRRFAELRAAVGELLDARIAFALAAVDAYASASAQASAAGVKSGESRRNRRTTVERPLNDRSATVQRSVEQTRSDQTTDDDALAREAASSSVSSPESSDLHGWRIAAMELLELWRSAGPAGPRPVFDQLTADSRRKLRDALAAKPLNAWEAIFARAAKSDYLAGRGEYPPITLWKALAWSDRIESGEFDTWERQTTPEEPARPAYRRWTAEDDAEIRESQRLAAEALAARKARGELPLSEQLRRRRAAARVATDAADAAHRDLSPLCDTLEAERQEAASEHIPPKERAS